MDTYTLALFGEAEKGDYRTAYFCQQISELEEQLGNPPPESWGLFFAVQALLYERNVIFFRVQEEGYSHHDYFIGLDILERKKLMNDVAAICIPGVGDSAIIQAVTPICLNHRSIMITTEPDLYDYLTENGFNTDLHDKNRP